MDEDEDDEDLRRELELELQSLAEVSHEHLDAHVETPGRCEAGGFQADERGDTCRLWESMCNFSESHSSFISNFEENLKHLQKAAVQTDALLEETRKDRIVEEDTPLALMQKIRSDAGSDNAVKNCLGDLPVAMRDRLEAEASAAQLREAQLKRQREQAEVERRLERERAEERARAREEERRKRILEFEERQAEMERREKVMRERERAEAARREEIRVAKRKEEEARRQARAQEEANRQALEAQLWEEAERTAQELARRMEEEARQRAALEEARRLELERLEEEKARVRRREQRRLLVAHLRSVVVNIVQSAADASELAAEQRELEVRRKRELAELERQRILEEKRRMQLMCSGILKELLGDVCTVGEVYVQARQRRLARWRTVVSAAVEQDRVERAAIARGWIKAVRGASAAASGFRSARRRLPEALLLRIQTRWIHPTCPGRPRLYYARRIQRWWRKMMSARADVERADRHRSGWVKRRVWKGWRRRVFIQKAKCHLKERRRVRLKGHVIRTWRAWLQKRLEFKNLAATQLQTLWRGHFVRKTLSEAGIVFTKQSTTCEAELSEFEELSEDFYTMDGELLFGEVACPELPEDDKRFRFQANRLESLPLQVRAPLGDITNARKIRAEPGRPPPLKPALALPPLIPHTGSTPPLQHRDASTPLSLPSVRSSTQSVESFHIGEEIVPSGSSNRPPEGQFQRQNFFNEAPRVQANRRVSQLPPLVGRRGESPQSHPVRQNTLVRTPRERKEAALANEWGVSEATAKALLKRNKRLKNLKKKARRRRKRMF